MIQKSVDVFMCCRDEDHAQVEQVSRQLSMYGIQSRIACQESFTKDLCQDLLIGGKIKSLAVFAGSNGTPLDDEIVEALVWEYIEGGGLVIPVILPDALEEAKLPVYLRRRKKLIFVEESTIR